MPITAFVVRVPSADGLVADLRNRFDSTFQLGVPAHISILVPFMDPARVTSGILAAAQEALSETSSFEFKLSQVRRFSATTYLAPEPSEPFVAMTASLARRFPNFLPYAGEHADVIPHLTVAHGNAENATTAASLLEEKVCLSGPIQAKCTSVVLLENSSGRWKEMQVFELPTAASPST